MPAALSARLVRLHRELYDALLRPVEFFRGSRQTLAECFYPDLQGTQVDSLIAALMFFFVRYSRVEVTVPRGLAVFRAVFFNHEAADPALWLYSSLERLKADRNPRPAATLTIEAPPGARVQGLTFALTGAHNLPPTSTRMIIGEARRSTDGHVSIKAEYGLDPSVQQQSGEHLAHVRSEVAECINSVFGWREVEAA
jgi:hypothetical protein